MFELAWIAGLIRRRAVRLAGLGFFVALAVMLIASLGMFFTSSKAQMTRLAAVGVPLDWQVQLAPGTNARAAAAVVAASKGVLKERPVGYGSFTFLRSTTGGTVQTTGKGVALGITSDWARTFPGEMRTLLGASQGVLVAQQTAANLQATVGDFVTIGRPGLPDARLRIDGVVDLPKADSLFQVVGAPPGSGATAPPDNVLVLPLATWSTLFDPLARVHPEAASTQLHVELAHALPPDPAAAFDDVVARARNLEAGLAGGGVVGDNLAAQLDAARADAVYAQLLFLFLGLPGAVLAGMLALVAGESGRERRRREQALLRMRGAGPVLIVRLATIEAALVALLGVVAGLAAAAASGQLVFRAAAFGASAGQTAPWVAAAAAAGVGLALAAVLLPAWRDARMLTVSAAQAQLSSSKGKGAARPLWARLYVDIALLGAGGLIFWQSMRDAYRVVVVPEGIPTISINYLTLLAPIAFWGGCALFAWRLSHGALAHARQVLVAALRPMAGGLSRVVAASMSRQHRLLSRGLVILTLTASFAVSVAVFNTTYMAQARVDAELTNGADVAATTAGAALPAGIVASARALPGVLDAEPMQHRFAYVGNDLQDIFGIDPKLIGRATPMSDAYFKGGNARKTLALLASRPDAVLVSEETVHDFQLQPGDLIRLRLKSAADHAYHVVPFHYVGVGREFPTAPRDSFLVANADYISKATGSPGFETLLVRTTGYPPKVAGELRALLGPASGATVGDIVTELKTTLSSLTAIDLTGLTRLELAFAVVLAVAASGLLLLLGFAERRRFFAIASALGAKRGQLASFVWAEALFVFVGGVVAGSLAGWLLSTVIVDILTGVFDPPPEHLLAPWPYLAGVLAVASVAVAIAAMATVDGAHRQRLEIIRDL
jgi:putative ABC transport system permease protein